MIKSKLILNTLLAVLFSVEASARHKIYWDYDGNEGPINWGDISPEYKHCKIGTHQSPIDIKNNMLVKPADIKFHYAKIDMAKVHNNGRTIQLSQSDDNYIIVDKQKYKLLQFHFHTPSEHTLNGLHHKMEFHLVHENDKGELAVVGVFIKSGKSNQILRLLTSLAPREEKTVEVKNLSIDITKLLPENLNYYHYSGSLTTPPCTENVKWYVVKDPVEASFDEISTLASILKFNARPTQSNMSVHYQGHHH